MNEEILNKIRNDYNERKKDKEEYTDNLDRLMYLETRPDVIEYNKTKDNIRDIEYKYDIDKLMSNNESRLLNDELTIHMSKSDDTNNIFVYMGDYRKVIINPDDSNEEKIRKYSEINTYFEDGPYKLVKRGEYSDFRIYGNIELPSYVIKKIPTNMAGMFEVAHDVIYPDIKRPSVPTYEEARRNISSSFLKDAIELGQDKSVSRVRCKYLKKH